MPRKSARASGPQRSSVRVIAGRWRGRRIAFEAHAGLRPTGDRIRETLFNWLQSATPASHCLDLYAGSGALGIEAASRGAASVTLVENHAQVVATLRREIGKLDADNVSVVHGAAAEYLQQIAAQIRQAAAPRFDIVFIDPPFEQGSQIETLRLCAELQLLSTGARLYVETAPDPQFEAKLSAAYRLLKSARAANVQYALLEYAG